MTSDWCVFCFWDYVCISVYQCFQWSVLNPSETKPKRKNNDLTLCHHSNADHYPDSTKLCCFVYRLSGPLGWHMVAPQHPSASWHSPGHWSQCAETYFLLSVRKFNDVTWQQSQFQLVNEFWMIVCSNESLCLHIKRIASVSQPLLIWNTGEVSGCSQGQVLYWLIQLLNYVRRTMCSTLRNQHLHRLSFC